MHRSPEESPWKSIWEKKGRARRDSLDLETLLAINGYDTAASNIATDIWLRYVHSIKMRLCLAKRQHVCEVGCGAGAFLYPLYGEGLDVSGIDYAANLIAICRKVMPSGRFEIAEARDIPFASSLFDAVVSSGVFIYFPSTSYAELAVDEIGRILKPGGRAAILDINDAEKRDLYESTKRNKLGHEEYERMYEHQKHLFLSKDWFRQVAATRHFTCQIEDQKLPGYENARFRFNVFLEKGR